MSTQTHGFAPEITGHILSFIRDYHNDSVWLWTDARLVDRIWKTEVERIFKDRHLKHTSIFIDGGIYWHSRRGKIMTSGHFEFARLSDDGNTATFVMDCHKDLQKIFKRRFNALNDDSDDGFGWIQHADIQIRRKVNDPLKNVVGLTADFDNLAIHCDWRDLFGKMYFEEKQYKMRMRERTNSLKRPDPDAPLISMEELMERMEEFHQASENFFRDVRRLRIVKQIQREWRSAEFDGPERYKSYTLEQIHEIEFPKNLDGTDEQPDAEALQHLKDRAWGASMAQFSDDEREEEDDEEEEEDDDFDEEGEEDEDEDGDGDDSGSGEEEQE